MIFNHEWDTELANRLGYSSWDRYASRAQFLFKDINLTGKYICDVGCGRGTWAVWCALQKATVVGLEPETDGSTRNTFTIFKQIVNDFGIKDSVHCEKFTIEEYLQIHKKKFDIIILYNVINHLGEDVVSLPPHTFLASKLYLKKLRIIHMAMNSGGILIIADCGRSNFWKTFGLRSPFASNIEWHKHQNPKVWEVLARKAGFRKKDLRWSYLYPLKHITANHLINFMTTSHFVLRLSA